MADPTAYDDPRVHVTADDLSAARRFVLQLQNRADREHYDTNRRWRAKCICGCDWPCLTQAQMRAGAEVLERALAELDMRRRFDQPWTGLDQAKLAVDIAGGKYATPTQPIRFGPCREPAEDGDD